MTKQNDVLLTNMASDFWYEGIEFYNFDFGGSKAGNTEAQKNQSNNFAQMVWKGVTKVGFGVSGKYVVAWYCEEAGVLENPNESLKNVGKVCYKHGYNQCYNDLAIAAHNKMRKNHKAEALDFDEDAARAIQHELNRADFNGQMPETTERATTFAGCGEAIFYQSDSSKKHEVSTTNVATDTWYSGMANYDFENNAPKTVPDVEYTV